MREEDKKLAEELLFGEDKKPSFAKRFYFGAFDSEAVFPFPEPSAEQQKTDDEFIERLEKFAQEKIDPVKIDREAKIPDEVLKGLADLGAMGMTVPKELGGLGMGQYAYCRTTEALAKRCSSTALFMNVHQSIGLKAFLLFGTEEQRAQWLPGLAKGEIFAAFSLTEPNAGSDANGIETRAVYDAEKKVYRLNGLKQWTSNGGIADILTVMAKTEDGKVTAFLVTPDMPGFKVRDHSLEKLGMRGTWTSNLAFEDMEVPEANILGPKGKGLKVALTILDFGRTTFGSMCTGVAKFCVAEGTRHAIERQQFGRSLSTLGMVKKKLTMMHALSYAMDATTYLTAGLIDNDVEDIMLESAILKVFTSDALWDIIYDTMQIFGGRSFFTDAPFERILRDSRLNMIGEGSNEVLRAFIGAVGLRDVGMDLKQGIDDLKNPIKSLGSLFKLVKKMIPSLPDVPVKSKQLHKEAEMLSKAVRRFSVAVVKVLAKYREDVVEHQLTLDRLATCVMCLYTTSAVLSKLDCELKKEMKENLEVGKFYCSHAMKVYKRHMDELFVNNDTEIENLSDQITARWK